MMSKGKTILLLEDQPLIAIDIEEILLEQGYLAVISLDTCAAAMDWLGSSSPDLAVVDPKLKDGFCHAVVSELVTRSVPFIVYSGSGVGTGEEQSIFKNGTWLSKPSPPEELLETVDRLLA